MLRFLNDATDPSLLLYGHYRPELVALSVIIAVLSSWLALRAAHSLENPAYRDNPFTRHSIVLSGALALGVGIWSMHFIGMLAFELCATEGYDTVMTLISMAPSIFASWVAISLLAKPRIRRFEILAGGIVIGLGIGAMHYLGMGAMELAADLYYEPYTFTLSILVAALMAVLALSIRYGLSARFPKLGHHPLLALASVVMGMAIAAMHYVGMAAARFVSAGGACPSQQAWSATSLSLEVAAFTLLTAGSIFLLHNWLQQKALYAQLERSESRFRALINSSVKGIIIIDPRGRVEEFNPACEAIFQYSKEEVLGRNVNMLMPEPYHAGHDGYLKHYLETGERKVIGIGREVAGRRKDGSVFPLELSVSEARFGEGRQAGRAFVGIVRDITEIKRIEQALRESEAQQRALIRNIPGVVYRRHIREPGTLVFMSDAVEAITGYTRDNFMGEDGRALIYALFHPDDREELARVVQQAIQDRGSFIHEFRIVRRDGVVRWVRLTGSVALDSTGEPQYLDVAGFDITDRRGMENDLRDAVERAHQAASAKTAFLANMSHEIRTPMNAIIGFLEIALLGELQPEQHRHLNTALVSARSLLRILNDILDTAKLEKGVVEIEQIPFRPAVLLDELRSSFALIAREKGIELIFDVDFTATGCRLGDPTRLRQVLSNLIGNAIKFTPSGEVRVIARNREDEIQFEVKDTGIGIPQGRLESIFAPFAQTDSSITRRFGGTGLGATIARQLVELMGGQLQVESTEDVGSRFHFSLPLPEVTCSELEPLPVAKDMHLPPLNILVAEDVALNAELLRIRLTRCGHRFTRAENGAKAVEMWRHAQDDAPYDLILMDVQMPVMDGLEATRQIRAVEQARGTPPHTPILALTAGAFDSDREAARIAGMDGFATKPLEFEKLQREMERVLAARLAKTPPPPSEEAAPEAPFPVLPGIDTGKAALVWGAEAYRDSLARFVADHSDTYLRLRDAFATRKWDTAGALAHALKGLAGTLFMTRLQKTAEEMEAVLRAGQHEAAESLMTRLFDALSGVIGGIQGIQGQPGAPAQPRPPTDGAMDATTWRSTLDKLTSDLRAGTYDDKDLSTLCRGAEQRGLGDQARALRQAMNQFDFDAAVDLLQTLSAHADEPSEPTP